MQTPSTHSRRRAARALMGALGVALALGGCAKVQNSLSDLSWPFEAAPGTTGPQLPTYRPGDTFIYDDGGAKPLVRTVTRADKRTVEWATESNYRYTTYRSFFLPKIRWDGKSDKGRLLHKLKFDKMWPLTPGSRERIKVRYRERSKKTGKSRKYTRTWECAVNPARMVTVPAGTFNAYEITCDRLSKSGDVTRTHTWYYAPTVGHFVKRIKIYRSKDPQVIELISHRRG